MRVLQKYAVRCGGGFNHRMGLFDGALIKDNHIAALGGVQAAVEAVRKNISHMIRIEVECETVEQVEQAVEAGADIVLLTEYDPIDDGTPCADSRADAFSKRAAESIWTPFAASLRPAST